MHWHRTVSRISYWLHRQEIYATVDSESSTKRWCVGGKNDDSFEETLRYASARYQRDDNSDISDPELIQDKSQISTRCNLNPTWGRIESLTLICNMIRRRHRLLSMHRQRMRGKFQAPDAHRWWMITRNKRYNTNEPIAYLTSSRQ